ncbi:MAG: hypothetical protein J6I38_07415 [Prevotella sp.]|nr:hypothetical protein [Prevotella sp.]
MNPFTYFSKKRREQRKKLKELRQFSSVFTTLDRLEQSGMLVWDQKQRRLFISQSLFVLTARDAESFVTFTQNVYLWLYYQQAQQAWSEHMMREELAAVRKASVGDRSASPLGSSKNHETVQLSRADVERIRLAARQQVAESDIEPPKVEPFEMFIVEDTVDAKPRIIAVGYFDPETGEQELAPWSEVSGLVRAASGSPE